MLRRSFMLGLTVVAALGIAGCGSDNNDKQSSAPATQAAPATPTRGGGKGAMLAITADAGGKLAFDKKSLAAKAGNVTIEFTNESQVHHNVTIEKGEQEAGGTEKGEQATETITASKTSRTVDLKPGTYTFYCSVDSHRQAGMEGTLTVR